MRAVAVADRLPLALVAFVSVQPMGSGADDFEPAAGYLTSGPYWDIEPESSLNALSAPRLPSGCSVQTREPISTSGISAASGIGSGVERAARAFGLSSFMQHGIRGPPWR